jgi:ribosome biogenesis GTPase A
MSAISTVFILMISGVIFLYGAVEPEEAEINAENAANDAQNRENAQRKQTEEVKLRSEEPARMAEEAKNAAQKEREKAEEAKRQPQAASERLEEALKAAEGQRIHAEEQLSILASQLEQAQTNPRMGLQPVVWPTEEEFNNVKKRVQYRSDRLHVALCGSSGTGKSSLINAVRGLPNQDDGAAPTGVATMNTQRYPDIRKEDPFPRFVWFDIPGGGGGKITDWHYFTNQGLFVFDVILVVYDTVSASTSY